MSFLLLCTEDRRCYVIGDGTGTEILLEVPGLVPGGIFVALSGSIAVGKDYYATPRYIPNVPDGKS